MINSMKRTGGLLTVWLNKYLLVAATMLLLAMPWAAQARCSSDYPGQGAVVYNIEGFDPGQLNPNVATGTVLFTKIVPVVSGRVYRITCNSNIGDVLYRGVTTTGTYKTYTTGIPGIGIRFKFHGAHKDDYWPQQDLFTVTTTALAQQVNIVVELVKTGPIKTGGMIQGEVAEWFVPAHGFQFGSLRFEQAVIIDPTRPTCTVATPDVDVPMGTVSINEFNGINSFSAAQPFELGLDCAGGEAGITTSVYTVLTDKHNAANRTNRLTLSPESTAKGVGIQVLNKAQPVSYGPASSTIGTANQWLAGTTGNGRFTIPLAARYIQTEAQITGGSANGAAIFTMGYK